MRAEELQIIDETVSRIGRKPEAVIPILQALQEKFRYLPEEALWHVTKTTEITPASIWGIATFYDQFRHRPVGKHLVHVCHGTACHVNGADRVEDALRRKLGIPPGENSDPKGDYTIEPVACLGCCTLAPVVRFDVTTYGHLTAERLAHVLEDFHEMRQQGLKTDHAVACSQHDCEETAVIKVGLGSCCMAKGSDRLFAALREAAREAGENVAIKRVGCVGMCHRTPLIEIAVPGRPSKMFSAVEPAEARQLVLQHFRPRGWWRRASRFCSSALDRVLLPESQEPIARHELNKRDPVVSSFFGKQVHIATEHFGKLDPLDLNEYLAHDGFKALRRCLDGWKRSNQVIGVSEAKVPSVGAVPLPPALSSRERENPPPAAGVGWVAGSSEDAYSLFPPPKGGGQGEGKGGTANQPVQNRTPAPAPDDLIDLITRAGVRGRGGAGYPTGPKWKVVRTQSSDVKYVICNGDEGDPGAFMDRMLLESFPYRIIEGLAAAAVAVGAHEGFFYIRREYPLAVERVQHALDEMERRGWLGDHLLGTGYVLKLSIKEGAGAFVCGEETALIASIEGKRGMPRLRPPFPAQSGLWGRPTLINNVETLALVPWIVRNGAEKFAAIGTTSSSGTKVFALAGKVRRGGLIEVPMGTTIREIVEDIGGGVAPGRRFKAVQIGGPSGGCVPARLADTPVDFESLREVGAIIGSGGLVVLDNEDCMVDIAHYFLKFTQEQSCGKCTFCRVGTRRMLDILELICSGKGRREHLGDLERLALQVGAGSLCGLGKTAPNPILTTLRYFRDEYEAHLQGHCPAGKCVGLIRYEINDRCTGCTICAQHCPADAISLVPWQRHEINQDLCTRCDTCRRVCPYEAVDVK